MATPAAPTPTPPPAQTQTRKKHRDFEGYLMKQGGGKSLVGGKGWKKRWCYVVRNRIYYAETSSSEFINFIYLNAQSSVVDFVAPPECGARFGMSIHSTYTTRVYSLVAETAEVREQWMTAIRAAIASADAVGRTPEQFAAAVMEANSTTDDFFVLDLVVEEAQMNVAQPYFAKLYYCGQKFKTWTVRAATAAPEWRCTCTFSEWFEPFLMCRLFKKSGNTNTRLAEGMLDLRGLRYGEQSELWLDVAPSKYKKKLHRGRVRFTAMLTSAQSPHALLAHRGVPAKSLPMRLDSGDIVLSNSTHASAFLTKVGTGSQWDHVALVFRDVDNTLKTLEATQDGVCLYRLDERLDDVREDSKLAVRHLAVRRTPAVWAAMYNFMLTVKGRPFKKNKMEMVNGAMSKNKREGDRTSMFCSELTAEAYQRMGFLSEARHANDYMPSSWADKSNSDFAFLQSATLERKFIFKQHKGKHSILSNEKLAAKYVKPLPPASFMSCRRPTVGDILLVGTATSPEGIIDDVGKLQCAMQRHSPRGGGALSQQSSPLASSGSHDVSRSPRFGASGSSGSLVASGSGRFLSQQRDGEELSSSSSSSKAPDAGTEDLDAAELTEMTSVPPLALNSGALGAGSTGGRANSKAAFSVQPSGSPSSSRTASEPAQMPMLPGVGSRSPRGGAYVGGGWVRTASNKSPRRSSERGDDGDTPATTLRS